MREMLHVTGRSRGRARETVALMTDGRFSGATHGFMICSHRPRPSSAAPSPRSGTATHQHRREEAAWTSITAVELKKRSPGGRCPGRATRAVFVREDRGERLRGRRHRRRGLRKPYTVARRAGRGCPPRPRGVSWSSGCPGAAAAPRERGYFDNGATGRFFSPHALLAAACRRRIVTRRRHGLPDRARTHLGAPTSGGAQYEAVQRALNLTRPCDPIGPRRVSGSRR